MMEDLRKLRFENLNEAAAEAQRLLSTGYERRGQWSLGQICRHCRLVQDMAVDGYPAWMSLLAPLRPLFRRMFLHRLMSENPPQGMPTSARLAPGDDLDDKEEVELFVASVDRYRAHEGSFGPHPAFGRMSREQHEKVQAAHAAHHLRFLEPRVTES